jgi:hypothetical protein
MEKVMDDYKYTRTEEAGHNVRTIMGRYGEYILIEDVQKILLQDSLKLQRDGQNVASIYAESFAKALENMKNG